MLLFGDLKRQPVEAVQGMYRFVGVNASFVPDFDTPHNVGGMPSSVFLERVLRNGAIRAAVSPLVPQRAVNWARRLRTRNMQQAPALPAELRRELTADCRDDILRTGELIGRRLDHWL